MDLHHSAFSPRILQLVFLKLPRRSLANLYCSSKSSQLLACIIREKDLTRFESSLLQLKNLLQTEKWLISLGLSQAKSKLKAERDRIQRLEETLKSLPIGISIRHMYKLLVLEYDSSRRKENALGRYISLLDVLLA